MRHTDMYIHIRCPACLYSPLGLFLLFLRAIWMDGMGFIVVLVAEQSLL